MMLLVDVGNTRVKWAVTDGRGRRPQQAAVHAGWTVDDWHRQLFADGPVERVVVATVAGGASRDALTAAADRAGIGRVEFVATRATACGVRNAYPQPGLLGVDRWVAVIGAYDLVRAPCCVVDVGTAATVDAVDGEGRHLGGYIVPGPDLMVGSLHAGTSDLARHTAASPQAAGAPFADNTRDAIERGCRVALAALVDRACADLAGLAGRRPALLLTGGAAEEVLGLLRSPARHVPDLVLHGLERLAAETGRDVNLEPGQPLSGA